ncbi:MAG: hypothetical protein ACRD9R_17545 [Pyrinomonadaceae bacterium]
MNDEQEVNNQVKEESPADKLQDGPQTDVQTAGAQKPESEVLNEKGVNTE